MEVLLDTCEPNSLHDALVAMGCAVTRAPLDVGDIHICLNNVVQLCIERKELMDGYASVIDGRYRNQKHRLLEQYGTRHVVYLYEGVPTKFMWEASPRAHTAPLRIVIGAQFNTMLRDQVMVWRTASVRETAFFIHAVVHMLEKGDSCLNKHLAAGTEAPETHTVAMEDYVDTAVQPVSLEGRRGKRLTNTDRYLLMLTQIHGMSIDKAKAVAEVFPNMASLVHALENVMQDTDRVDMLKNLQCGKRKLGPKLAERIIQTILYSCCPSPPL